MQNEICISNHDLFAPLMRATQQVAIAPVPRSVLRAATAVPVSHDLGPYPQLDSSLALILQDGAGRP